MAKSKGSSAVKAITSLFWQPIDDEDDVEDISEEESAKTVEDSPTKEAAPIVSPTPTSSTETPPAATSVTGSEDAEIKESLSAALAAANKDGYDYFEFAQAVQAQKKFIPAEQIRYQSVFSMAAPMGVTVESLLCDIDHYMDALKAETKKFQDIVDRQTTQNVTGKEKELAGIDSAIEEKATQIQALTEDINQLSATKSELSNTIADNRAQIEKVQRNFGTTLKVFIDRLTGDAEKIEKYLGGFSETTESAKEAADA